MAGIEEKRLKEDKLRTKHWKRWGPYLSERQWGTVREDYSPDGNCWNYFPHDHARSRAYRWGEDGLLGVTDRQCRLCLAPALWNGKDPILKERLFGLTGNQGNHGEDVKELYYYLDCTPTHSYMKALYKYPQREFPYADLEAENMRRGVWEAEYELLDTGVFDDNRYFDVLVEYCKGSPNDILARFTISNRGPEKATIHVLPTLWFRNVWSWGESCDAANFRPKSFRRSKTHIDGELIRLKQFNEGKVYVHHPTLASDRVDRTTRIAPSRSRLNSMDRYVDDDEIPTDLTEEADAQIFGRQSSMERRSGSFGRQSSLEFGRRHSFSRHHSIERQDSGDVLERQSNITKLQTLRPTHHNGPFLDEDVFKFEIDKGPDGKHPPLLFTENNTNSERLYGTDNETKHVKDAFHESVIRGKRKATNTEEKEGTKCCAHYVYHIEPGQEVVCKVRLYHANEAPAHARAFSVKEFDNVFQQRILEADLFYDMVIPSRAKIQKEIARQAYAGLLWSKQFYYYIQKEWINGDKGLIAPPTSRKKGRNKEWTHLFNRDVISMPDKWEYPWYASWDLAFHMIPMANIDIQFAKSQLVLFLREWYMHPNGQIPAYEFSFDDVNPPVHAYAVLKVYKRSGLKGTKDLAFLTRCFHKLVLNFTWWVNRKDVEGKNIFSGGFLGLDNIGVFDRSKPLPSGGGFLAQADATAWMGFFCSIMLEISLILANRETVYQDMASKFFEHYVAIIDAMNNISELGLWDEADGFYYDQVRNHQESQPLKIKSVVGLVPLFCTLVLKQADLKHHPGFHKRTRWFIDNRKDLAKSISFMQRSGKEEGEKDILLAVVNKEKLVRLLEHILDEDKFLSPYGIRSLSKEHQDHPFVLQMGNSHDRYSVRYEPGESESKLFGGNSNWRGPIWLPMNFLLIENLQRFDYFYGEELKVQCPTGSGNLMRLSDVAKELSSRLISLFVPDIRGYRPCHGGDDHYALNRHFKQLNLFYEYFHGDTGRGCGASHQTGWTALIVNILEKCAKDMDESISE